MSEAILSTQGLCKSFGALTAADNVSIDLVPGEIHAIIGPNGAGKSTLIQLICGSLKPDRGTISLDGIDVTHRSVQNRARDGLARTFQISALAMEDSVLSNAMLGAIGHDKAAWRFWSSADANTALRARAEEGLARVGLSDHLDMTCAALSHGQRRQLEVAVALTLSPKAFVMDEPMAGLGAEATGTMTEFLADLRNDAPILLVEHDMDAVFALADRISVLVSGRIVASGSVEEIRASAVVKDAYLGSGS